MVFPSFLHWWTNSFNSLILRQRIIFCHPSREILPTAFLQQRDRISTKKAHSKGNASFLRHQKTAALQSAPRESKRAPEKDARCLKSLHSSRLLQSKRYEFFWKIWAEIFSLLQPLKLPGDTTQPSQEILSKGLPVHVISSSPEWRCPYEAGTDISSKRKNTT